MSGIYHHFGIKHVGKENEGSKMVMGDPFGYALFRIMLSLLLDTLNLSPSLNPS